MKRTLYLKLLVGYVAFGILGFLTIATFTSHHTINYIETEAAEDLYRESNLIASNYAANYYRQTMTLEDVQSQLAAVATYLNADIWVVNTKGTILIDSETTTPPDTPIEGFDITSFGAKYYLVGNFYHTYSEEVLTVFSLSLIHI